MSQGKSREMSRLFSFMSFNVINLTFKRDRRNVLSNVDLSLLPGELVGLLGANGAGKSTFMKLIYAEEEPTEGTVYREGKERTKT